jgi:hypothetical protein
VLLLLLVCVLMGGAPEMTRLGCPGPRQQQQALVLVPLRLLLQLLAATAPVMLAACRPGPREQRQPLLLLPVLLLVVWGRVLAAMLPPGCPQHRALPQPLAQ